MSEEIDSRLGWALGQLRELVYLPGGPKNKEELVGCAKAFLRIVQNKTLAEWQSRVQDEEAKQAYVALLGGYSTDAEWLIAQLADSCEMFPKPIQMRKIYEQCFTPADGVKSGELLARLG